MLPNYNTVQDLVNDESFIKWANGMDDASIAYWENWIENNPDKKEMAYNASKICTSVFVKEGISTAQTGLAEQKLFHHLKTQHRPAKVYSIHKKRLWAVAAAILIIAGTVSVLLNNASEESFKTSFGQTRQQNLPDGSLVTLNANSSIAYNKWTMDADREVWIKGEAFFHVKKTADHRRFIVHANHFDIIVTGTQFNVVNRDDKTNVMLTEGSVTIKKDDGEQIVMKPGDFIELNNNSFVKKEEKKEDVLAWKEHKLYFDNISIAEAAKMIEEQYGVTVKVADDATASKTISGILPNNNLELLLSSLEATADFKITRNNGEIIIGKP
jgi:transmembrane sensor